MKKQGDLIFTLDIGTRTVIGLVMKKTDSAFEIIASKVEEHEHRSMLDGQIHNIQEVTTQVNKVKKALEAELELKLERVSVAAAGRALKTINYQHKITLENKREITAQDVRSIEFTAIREAQVQLASNKQNSPDDYHFVGYSVNEYLLDGLFIGELEGQSGREIEVKIIATFLPRVVVDSLLSVINKAELEVDYLTLEPIAAASVVIPRDMYSFNLALIDIGAGTSDIALTKKGAMIGYAMVPLAGDEVTEALAERYLLDYQTAEAIKCSLTGKDNFQVRNILSQDLNITQEDGLAVIKPVVEKLAVNISETILTLNQKAPQAIICIGGGSLTPLLLDELAASLGIDRNRVGIKSSADIKYISGEIKEINNAQAITPLGIALTSYQHKDKVNFIEVKVNQQSLQIFTVDRPTVADALLTAEVNVDSIKGRTGPGITCTVNGQVKALQGTIGNPGKILVNGENANLDMLLYPGDQIIFKPGKNGQAAAGNIADVLTEVPDFTIFINGEEVELAPIIYQNGKQVKPDNPLLDGATIKYHQLKTIRDGIALLYDIPSERINDEVVSYQLNGERHYFSRGDLLVFNQGNLSDVDQPLKNGLRLEVIWNNNTPETPADLIADKQFKIIVNGNELEVPTRINVYCNGNRIDSDYKIQDGDQLVIKSEPISINYLLDFINYRVTPSQNLLIMVNDKPASLNDQIMAGDKIKIRFS